MVNLKIRNFKVENLDEIIAHIVDYESFLNTNKALRAAYRADEISAQNYYKICDKIGEITGFKKLRYDYNAHEIEVRMLLQKCYTVKAIFEYLSQKYPNFRIQATQASLTKYISNGLKNGKFTKITASAKKNKIPEKQSFLIKKLHFQGFGDKEIARIINVKFELSEPLSKEMVKKHISENLKRLPEGDLSLYKKPSRYDKYYSEIIELYQSGMKIYDIWKHLRGSYDDLSTLQAPSLYQYIANNALGRAKYMKKI